MPDAWEVVNKLAKTSALDAEESPLSLIPGYHRDTPRTKLSAAQLAILALPREPSADPAVPGLLKDYPLTGTSSLQTAAQIVILKAIDPDHDGLTNLQEFQRGSNPQVPDILLEIVSGNHQAERKLLIFDEPLVVRTSYGGAARTGVKVTFTASAADVYLGTTDATSNLTRDWKPKTFTAESNEEGIIKIAVRAGSTMGPFTVSCSLFQYPISRVNFSLTNTGGSTGGVTPSDDRDLDGLPNAWEVKYGFNPDSTASEKETFADTDNDDLINLDEYTLGTDPRQVDTDADTMKDGWEVRYQLDPLFNDGSLNPDSDGLVNSREFALGTDPRNADSDGDLMPDGWEVANALDPLNLIDASQDPDSDGYTNYVEYVNGTSPRIFNGGGPVTGGPVISPPPTRSKASEIIRASGAVSPGVFFLSRTRKSGAVGASFGASINGINSTYYARITEDFSRDVAISTRTASRIVTPRPSLPLPEGKSYLNYSNVTETVDELTRSSKDFGTSFEVYLNPILLLSDSGFGLGSTNKKGGFFGGVEYKAKLYDHRKTDVSIGTKYVTKSQVPNLPPPGTNTRTVTDESELKDHWITNKTASATGFVNLNYHLPANDQSQIFISRRADGRNKKHYESRYIVTSTNSNIAPPSLVEIPIDQEYKLDEATSNLWASQLNGTQGSTTHHTSATITSSVGVILDGDHPIGLEKNSRTKSNPYSWSAVDQLMKNDLGNKEYSEWSVTRLDEGGSFGKSDYAVNFAYADSRATDEAWCLHYYVPEDLPPEELDALPDITTLLERKVIPSRGTTPIEKEFVSTSLAPGQTSTVTNASPANVPELAATGGRIEFGNLLPVEIVEEVETDEEPKCTGYDKDEKALMVPMSGSNKIRVKIGASADLLSKMKIVASDPSKLTIQPETPASSDQVLTLSGSAKALGVKIQLEMNGSKTDLFEADVLERLEKTIEIHAITEQNDDVQSIAVGVNGAANAICVSSGANGFRDTVPGGDDVINGNNITVGPNGICDTTANNQNLVPVNVPTAASLQSYLNGKTWGNQANVHFTVTRTDHVVNYDLDRNKKLADEYGISATRAEDDAITAAARNAGTDFNVYYVNEHEWPVGITLRAQVFTQGFAPGSASLLNHTAHEVGHLIGRIGHVENDPEPLMYKQSLASRTCRVLRSEWRMANP